MKIEFGKAFDNKTWRFLIPTIRGHGEDFVNRFNIMIRKLAYGIYDKALEGAQILEDRRPIFILCDKNSVQFEDFLIYIRNQYFFITDYQSDSNTINPRMHMIVIEIPEEYNIAYDKFSVGLYSEMYTKEQLDYLFKDKESAQYKILSRNPQYGDIFIDKIKTKFGVHINGPDKDEFVSVAELEFPYSLDPEEEIFNY